MTLRSALGDLARRLSPPRDRHFVVVPRLRLVYGRVPKVANTAIRGVLAAHVDRIEGGTLPANTDRFWDGQGARDAAIVSGRRVLADYPDHFVFSVVRDPFDRLVSCWSDMIDTAPKLLPSLERLGFRLGMPFAGFVERVAATPDRVADLHFRSQASLLTVGDRLVPAFVGRYERLDDDWAQVRARVLSTTGVDLGALPKANVRRFERADVERLFADPALVDVVRHRFAEDFRRFYPDLRQPVTRPPIARPVQRPAARRRRPGRSVGAGPPA